MFDRSHHIVTPKCRLVPVTHRVSLTTESAAHYDLVYLLTGGKHAGETRPIKVWYWHGAYKRYRARSPGVYEGKANGLFFRGAKVA